MQANTNKIREELLESPRNAPGLRVLILRKMEEFGFEDLEEFHHDLPNL